MRQRWRQTIGSALLYTLAFNLTFFIQELFLVVPKALTPGLRPTLYHNNHLWLGENPLAHLLQGTGALAIFISAILCTLLLKGDRIRSTTVRLFLLWMAFSGFFQALPQVVIGAFVDNNHVGMALNYFADDAWRIKDVAAIRDPEPVPIAYPLAAVIALLLVFQLVLRPGIEFY
jgi:hypothetical protein